MMIVSEKITSKFIKLYSVFIKKKDLKLIRNGFFLVKKWEKQVIIFMIMLTGSSKRIYNPMNYTGIFFIHYRYMPEYENNW